MKAKRTFAFIFFMAAGIIVGSLCAGMTASIPYLRWLSYGKSLGVPMTNPFILDLVVMKISLAVEVSINIAQVIFMTIGMFIYRKAASKL